MNYKHLAFTILGAFGIFALMGLTAKSGNTSGSKSLELTIRAEKESFLPGEVVFLTLTVTNKGQEAIAVFDDLIPAHGYTKFLISNTSGEFKEYRHSKWGTRDAKVAPVSLKPNEKFSRPASILWNSQRKFDASVSPEIVKAETENKIPHDYAFPEPGIYYVKAVYSSYIVGNKQDRRIELVSDPIRIIIDEPVGEDLVVWNAVKDNGGVAYFLQEGNFSVPG